MMVKEEYIHAEGSPVVEKKFENSRLIYIFHFDLNHHPRSRMVQMTMITYYRNHYDGTLYRHPNACAVIQEMMLYHGYDFKKELGYFIRKVRKYIDNLNPCGIKPEYRLALTREEAKEIRTFLRDRFKETVS